MGREIGHVAEVGADPLKDPTLEIDAEWDEVSLAGGLVKQPEENAEHGGVLCFTE